MKNFLKTFLASFTAMIIFGAICFAIISSLLSGLESLFDFGKNYPEPAQTIDYVHQTWVTVRIPVEHLLSIYDSYIAGYNNSYHIGKLFCMHNRHGRGEIYISSIILRSNTLHESGVDFGELTK